MNATVTIDKAGRLVVPKALRSALHLQPGDVLDVHRRGETLVLEPRHERGRLFKAEDGLWVFSSGTGLALTHEDVDQVLEQTRLERESRILGTPEEDGAEDE